MVDPLPPSPVNDYVLKVVRTLVPLALSFAASVLAKNFNFVISEEWLKQQGETISLAIVPVVMAVYYLVISSLETKFPWIGILLGYPRQPTYKK